MSSDHQDHKQYVYFVDGKEIKSDVQLIYGTTIKDKGGIPANYQLMMEGHGNDPDVVIGDSQSVDLSHGAKHFYGAPPATYGDA